MTSVLSITHRATGLALSALLSGAAVGSMALTTNFPAALAALQATQLGAPTLFALKFAIAWPVAFHTLNGIRHLVLIKTIIKLL